MKRTLITILLTGSMTFASLAVEKAPETPVSVVLDTDLGNDIDDLLALQMLINYEKQGKVDVKGITVSKANTGAYELANRYYDKYGCANPAFGYVGDGPNQEGGNYLAASLDALGIVMNHTPTSDIPDATSTLRKLLRESEDSSLTIIAIGPMTNMSRLLDSDGDQYNCMSGKELIRKKVRRLVVMGGDFREDAGPEWNVKQDVVSARKVFEEWPSEIIAAGFEVGAAVLYPHHRVVSDFGENHPLRIGYENFLKMPYNRPCWDLTAVLYAIEPESGYLSLSEPGRIAIDDEGRSIFKERDDGKHRYVILRAVPERFAKALADCVGVLQNPQM